MLTGTGNYKRSGDCSAMRSNGERERESMKTRSPTNPPPARMRIRETVPRASNSLLCRVLARMAMFMSKESPTETRAQIYRVGCARHTQTAPGRT